MREGGSVRKWMLIVAAAMLLPGCALVGAETRIEQAATPVVMPSQDAYASDAPAATSSPSVVSTPTVVAPQTTPVVRDLPLVTAVPRSKPSQSESKTAPPSAPVTASPKAGLSSPATSAPDGTAKQDRCSAPDAKCIALTFDDGPGPHTQRVLDALDAKGAKATFFVLGSQVRGHEALLARMTSSGMEVGNHTWSHSDLARLSRSRQIAEINDAGAAIEQASGQRLSLVRPPYGSFSATTKSLGVPLALWNVDTLDWRHRSAVKTVAAVKAGARPGAVVLLHDIHASTADAVPEIVKMLSSEGYTMVTMSELLASCGGAPAGQTVSGC